VESKYKIITIAYFDINQKNGGAIFAKKLNDYLNHTDNFISKVYCNIRTNVSQNTSSKDDEKTVSIFSFIKKKLISNKNFELLIHFIRNDINAITLITKLFFRNKIDKNSILVFHDHLSLFYFSLFFNTRNRKVILIMHNDGSPVEMVSSGLKNKFKIRILNLISTYQIKCVVSDVKKTIFLCDLARDKFINLYDVNLNNTAVIPNGINSNVNFIRTDSKKLRFITVCTMNERKGIDTFIKLLPILNNKYESKLDFTLIGNGPLLEELKQLQIIHKNLHVIGEISDVSNFLNKSDVFFLLSKNEGQPLSILEAMRASLFILATNVGCNASMVTPINGILVEVNHKCILKAFCDIIENWDSLKDKSLNSFQLFESLFTEKKMYQSYIQIFKEVSL
jgi:glycosyltransferase involved in cell wall biosynthesis